MTAILEILAQIWPLVLAGLGLVFGYVRHKQAQTTAARAEQKVAEAERREAQAGEAVAQANTEAAKAGANAAQERANVENRVAADDDSQRVLIDQWARD